MTTLDSIPQSRSQLWPLWLFAFVWPMVAAVVVQAITAPASPAISNTDLQKLLDAHRYTVHIPVDCDGWFLGLETVANGQRRFGGDASVAGGSDIVLLLRENKGAGKIEYCWYGNDRACRGVIDNPIKGCDVASDRPEGGCAVGDWLMRGGDQLQSDKPADYEIRVALRPPHLSEATEEDG